MPSTPSRALRSNSSTPVSGNTAGSISTRSRRRKEQPPIEFKENDEDDEDEPMLQTQQPLPTQYERKDDDPDEKDEEKDYDDEEEDDGDEDYREDDADKNVTGTKSHQSFAFSKVKRTSRKTISNHSSQTTSTSVPEDIEEVEDTAAVAVKPEATEEIDGSENVEMIRIDPNFAKHRIHQYYYDILDQEQHTILFEHSARITSWPILQHFWSFYPFNEYEYGRMYVRTRLCSLLVDGNSEAGNLETSLVAWEATDWQDFIDDLRTTREACLDPNCTHVFGFEHQGGASFLSSSISDIERKERLVTSQHRACSKNFNQKYAIVEKTCHMNLLMANIRQTIEAQIRSGANGPPTDIPEIDVERLHAAVVSCDSVVVRKHLYRLFVPADDNDPDAASNGEDYDGATPKPVLKNIEDLKDVLGTKPLNLTWLQKRIDQLIWSWNEECFGSAPAYLEEIKYHDTARQQPNNRMFLNRNGGVGATKGSSHPKTPPARDKEDRVDVLETLKRRRNALNKNHGDDPLIESRKIAATTKANTQVTTGSDVVTAKNILYQGKKSNIVVQFDDSEEEDDDYEMKQGCDEDDDVEDEDDADGNDKRVRLPKLPKKRRILNSPSVAREGTSSAASRIYTGPPPDDGIFDDKGNVLQRHPWNDEEIAALLSGLQKHGLGKWVYIKQEYGYILRNRTTVQLKDKYRNMKKNNELPERYMEVEM